MRWLLLIFMVFLIMGCKQDCSMKEVEINDSEQFVNGTLAYEISSFYKYTDMNNSDIIAGAVVKVKNADTDEGVFSVVLEFTLENSTKRTVYLNQRIKPGETGEYTGEVIADTEEEEKILIGGQVIPPAKISMRKVTRTELREVCE